MIEARRSAPDIMEDDRSLHVAAVDLGSNSFHMVIARQTGHDLQILDRLREPVRLAEGLNAKGRLSNEAQGRALGCLERFGQRIKHIPPERVRAVGTNTLRVAKRVPGFRVAARHALGHPIEIISGAEEARLIYLGVAHSMPATVEERLVVDIGGGSTELIAGHGFDVKLGASLFMGCVMFSQKFFDDGRLRREDFREAETAAQLELQSVESKFRQLGWQRCIGASGTVEAISTIVRQMGFSEREITLRALKKLRKAMLAVGRVDELALPGLKPDRRPVLAGGLAILIAVFKSLGIVAMESSQGALRDGVLYDLLGRIQHEDVRDRTIRRMVEQYRVDLAQSARVQRTALRLLEHVREIWELTDPYDEKLLRWAAQLHEVGLGVAHTGYHKHGAYLVAVSDMPGFSFDDQQLLAAIIRGHRRKLRFEFFRELSSARIERSLHLCVVLRLAVLLNRSRAGNSTPPVQSFEVNQPLLRLSFAEGWLAHHPLTRADLELETKFLSEVGIELCYADVGVTNDSTPSE